MGSRRANPVVHALLGLAVRAASGAAEARQRSAAQELTLVRQIGSDLDEEAAFYRIADLAVDDAGKIYVLDSGDHRVIVFDSAGRRLTAFGRRGGGPGEFTWPIRVVVDSVVRVFDAGQNRVSTFARDGSHLGTTRLPSISGQRLSGFFPLRGGHALATTALRFTHRDDDDPYTTLLAVRPPSTVTDTLARHRASAALYHKRDAYAPWGLLDTDLGAGGAWALSGDSLPAIADGYEGKVTFYRVSEAGFTRAAEVRLPERGRPVTEAETRTILQAAVERSGLRAADVAVQLPPLRSAARAALFSHAGELWVQTGAEGGVARWWVVDPTRDAIREVRLPEGFELQVVRGDLLYGTARTELDVPVVQVYRLR